MVAHFSVDGEGLTTIARNIMLSEDPGRAVRLLSTGLVGLGASDVAQQILDGTTKLVGIDLHTEPDDDPDYKRQLAYIYAGRFRCTGGAWIRVSGCVRMFSTATKRWAAGQLELRGGGPERGAQAMDEWQRMNAKFYASPGEQVHKVGGLWTLWEPCGEPPFWWQRLTMEQAFQQAQDAGRRIEEHTEAPTPEEVRLRQRQGRLQDEPLDEPFEDTRREVYFASQEARRDAECKRVKDGVRQQAGNDLFPLVVFGEKDGPLGRTYMVPRAPFECWALRRSRLAHLAPDWVPVARSGLKLSMDDEFHTDWTLGAGIELEQVYDKDIVAAADAKRFELQQALGDNEADVINASEHDFVSGTVGKEIVVLPSLSPEYATQVMGADVRAIVADVGGALSHIALVGRERNLVVIRAPGAFERLKVGTEVAIDTRTGQVRQTVRRGQVESVDRHTPDA